MSRKRQSHKKSSPTYSHLEAREMLAGDSTFFLDPATSTLFITAGESSQLGAGYANQMDFEIDSASNELVVTEANKGVTRYPAADVLKIDYRGTDLADKVTNNTSIDARVTSFGGNDLITSGSGNDVVLGGQGNDTIFSGEGDDFVNGGRGDDTIFDEGALGEDRLFGADGADVIRSEGGDDLLIGHQGADRLTSSGGNNTVFGGEGNDRINTGLGNDFAAGQDGDDIITSDGGDNILMGNAGIDTINGADGLDRIYGGDDGDSLFGGGGNDRIVGHAGADTIHGGDGNDSLDGGDGDDTIYGTAGNDVIFGQQGNDILVGGDGVDTVFAAFANARNDSFGVDDIRTVGDSAVDVIVAHPRDQINGDSNDSVVDTNRVRLNQQAQFLIDNLNNSGWAETASGLQYNSIQEGTGATPTLANTVRVDYDGRFIEGTQFDANDNISFPLNRVIRGWQEGLQLMKVGGVMDFAIPADLAYGDFDRPGIPGGSVLLFRVTLHEVVV